MQEQLKQINSLLQQQNYQKVVEECEALLKKDQRALGAMIYLAQAQIQLNELLEAQNVLNDFYSKVKRGGPDDPLFFNALITQETLAIQLQTSSNSTQNKKRGREMQLTNKFQIIDFLDKKQKYEKMLQEMETYFILLVEENRYKDVEENLIWLMNHEGLSKDQRAEYALRILEIDPYYKPQLIKADQIFAQLLKLIPDSPKLSEFALKNIIENLDNSNTKKTIYSALVSNNPKSLDDFEEFRKQVVIAGNLAFKKPEHAFKNPATVRMFIRYIGAVLIQLEFLSEDWNEKIETLRSFCESEPFKSFKSKALKNQIQLLTASLLDMTRIVKEALIPKDFNELAISKLGSIDEILNIISEPTLEPIEKIQNEALEVSPFVNAYLAVCALTENPLIEVDPVKIQAKIKQAQFVWTKMQPWKSKSSAAQSANLDVYLECLKLLLKLDKAQVDTNFQTAELCFTKFQEQILTTTQNLYLSLTVGLKWQNYLRDGDWIKAINALEQLAKLKPEEAQFVQIKICEIQLQNLSALCETQAQKEDQIKAIYNTLMSLNEASSLQLQGYLIYCFGDILESDQKAALNKWLLALKKDQTNPETFYSLAVYYFNVGDLKRSSGCLDKALKLRGGFELALVLAYHLVNDSDSRLQLLDKFMQTNRSSAVSYFLRGLLMQEKQDFIQAIEMYQNAMKFHTISGKKVTAKNLLPPLKLAITENPLGIFGNQGASICWVYLSDCFSKIEKPNVALKCFNQALTEISRLQSSEEFEPSEEVKQVLKLIDYNKFKPSVLETTNDPNLKLLAELKPQKWALECLLLGSKFVQTPQQSISVLHVALRCLPSKNIQSSTFAFILTEIIHQITVLIKQGVVVEDGQAKLLSQSQEMIVRLQKLVDFCVSLTTLDRNLNLQKKIINALFVISQKNQNENSSKAAMARADYLATIFEQSTYQKAFLLDACKIIHEHRRFSDSEDLYLKKIKLIRQAICQEPQQANLWVHLYLFSQDPNVQAKAIFKAYELEPESTFVQEHILRFYLKTKQWSKAFKILVRSYQQATSQNLPQQPIVLATLAYLNAVCYLEFGKVDQLQEAISLIRMIQREDMTTLLSELLTYLRHFAGDYISSISYLKKHASEDNNLLLLKAYFGAKVTTFEQAKQNLSLFEQSQDLLKQVFEAENQSNSVLKDKCQQLITEFSSQPLEVATTLALYQEICLQKGVVLEQNILDGQQVKTNLQYLSHGIQRILMIQSLRMIQQRDGKITENIATLNKDGNLEEYRIKSQKTYTEFVVGMSRFKPANLTAIQHRALFRYFINCQSDDDLLRGIFNQEESQARDQNLVKGLSIMLSQKKDEEDNSQTLFMQNPLCLSANTKWIWSLLRAGKLDQAKKAYKLLTQKLQLGLLNTTKDDKFQELDYFMQTLNSSNITERKLNDRLHLISQIAVLLCGNQDASSTEVRLVAAKIIQVIKKLVDYDQQKIINLLIKTLDITLYDQCHFVIYSKLLKELLNFSQIANLAPATINLLWHFQLLNTGSTLIETKKLTQISAICKEAEKLNLEGIQKRSNLPIQLIQARMHFSLNNHKLLVDKLKVDDAVLERDFLLALSQYTQQNYKEFYLLCIGLVAGAKASQQDWQLAYAYYLKAFAEMTFFSARNQGIVLKDDFDASETDFDTNYFKKKAKSSIGKCKNVLVVYGLIDSLIGEAITQMESQLDLNK